MSGADLVMTADEIEASIRLADLGPKWGAGLPLSHAALAGALDLAFLQREIEMPRVWSRARNMPLVAVVVDTVGKPAGPTTWRSTAPLVAWAEITILHRAGASAGHYRHAAELAKTHLRVLLIEASAETFEAWLTLLHRRPELPVEVLR